MKQNLTLKNNVELKETLSAIKLASADKKTLAMDKIIPIVENILNNTDVFDEIVSEFLNSSDPLIKKQIVAINKRTERCANKIIDATAEISSVTHSLPEPDKTRIQNSINTIYEGCNFQDLVSQHVQEINKIVNELSEDMAFIQKVLSNLDSTNKIKRIVRQKREDSHLLNGPTTDVDEPR